MLDLHPLFAPFFPIGSGLVTLEVVPLDHEPSNAVANGSMIVLRLIVFEERDGDRSVRDIKEQQIFGGAASLYDDHARVDEMLYAQQEVLGEALGGPVSHFEGLMPHDLLFTNVLRLARARTRDDFAKALRVKSRLGRLLLR